MTDFEMAWHNDGLVLGQTSACKHCYGLIIVIDANADTEDGPVLGDPDLMWRHVTGYFACNRPGTMPQAEPREDRETRDED